MKELYKGFKRLVSDRDYEFLDEADCISVLPFYLNDDGETVFVIRKEICPAYQNKVGNESEYFYTPIGGMIDPGEDAMDAMIRELYEESGIMSTDGLLTEIFNDVPLTKASNVRINFYLLQLNTFEQTTPCGDGTIWEELSESIHVTEQELEKLLFSAGPTRFDAQLLLLYHLYLARYGQRDISDSAVTWEEFTAGYDESD